MGWVKAEAEGIEYLLDSKGSVTGAVRNAQPCNCCTHAQAGVQAHMGVSAGEGRLWSKAARPTLREGPWKPRTTIHLPVVQIPRGVHICLSHVILKATL